MYWIPAPTSGNRFAESVLLFEQLFLGVYRGAGYGKHEADLQKAEDRTHPEARLGDHNWPLLTVHGRAPLLVSRTAKTAPVNLADPACRLTPSAVRCL